MPIKGERSPLEATALELLPDDQFKPLMKMAADRLAVLCEDPVEIYKALFNKEQLEWLREQYQQLPS